MDADQRTRLRALCSVDADPVRVHRADLADVLDALDAAERERDDARAEVETLRAEAALLREIIEGRTTPPTAAEVAAYDGAWLLCEARGIEGTDGSAGDVADWTHVKTLCIAKENDVTRCCYLGGGPDVSVGDVIIADRDGMGTTYWWADGTRWWPLDADGRPCAWPTVTP